MNWLGEQIAEKNLPRIEKYCHAYWMPMFYYVMKQQFGFGYERLNKMHDGIVHIFDVLSDPRFLEICHLWEGLDLECDHFKPKRVARKKTPATEDIEGFSEMYAYNASLSTVEHLEIVWLWVLHDSFGFGKKRLERCTQKIKELQQVPEKMFNFILDELEKVGKGNNKLNFSWVRSTMSELSVKGYSFDDGLVLVR